MESDQVPELCQFYVKRILFSQADFLQVQQKKEKEREERRTKLEKKKILERELLASAGMNLNNNSRARKNTKALESATTEDELNLLDNTFYQRIELDEDEICPPKKSPFETNEHYRVFEGYYKFVNTNGGILSKSIYEMRFKGILPNDHSEYVYTAKVAVRNDSVGEYFIIEKLLATDRNDLNYTMLQSMIKRYCGQDSSSVQRLFEHVRKDFDHDRGIITYKKFCDSLALGGPEWLNWLKALQEKSPFFANYDKFPLQTLIRCFPNDFIYLKNLEMNNPPEFVRLWEEFTTNIKSFFYKPICREWSLTTPLHLLSYLTWFIQNNNLEINIKKPLDMDKFVNPKYGTQVIASVDLYRKIKKYLNGDGSTAFIVDQYLTSRFLDEERKDENLEEMDIFKMLVEAKVLLRQDYGNTRVYAPRSSAKATKVILDCLEGICKRFEPLPFNMEALDPKYTESQLRTFALTQEQPIVCCTAPPGFGKTTTIEGLVAIYGQENCILATQVACMVTGHRQRGLKSDTLAMLIHRRFPKKKFNNIFNKSNHELIQDVKKLNELNVLYEAGLIDVETPEDRIQQIIDQYAKIKVLIVDEASNMDNKMASMFLNCFPKAQLVVFVFDDGQIGPISPGQLAFDLLKFFKDNNFPLGQLTENMRVNRDPRAQQILLNDQLLMSGKVKEMKFNPLPDSNEHLPPGTFMAEYKDQEDLKQKIHQLYTQQIPNVDLLKVITLTNRERTTVNDCVDELMKMRLQDEDDEDNKVPVTAKYYHGQRLMVYNQNYHEKKVSDRPHAVSNAINNGEEFTFGKCRSLILSPNRAWTGEGKGYAEMQHLLPMTKNADKYRIFFIDDKGEKRYCIGDGFIQVDNIQPAWAITSNKSQGREYEYVIVVLPRTIGQMPRCFIRNHLHVMVSRPKTILVVLGSREVLETLAQRQANDRFTLLANLFSLRLTRYFKTTKTITFRLNEKIQDYKQHQLDNKAHFESLDKPKSSKKSASAPKRKPKQETEDSSSSDDDVNFMSPTKIAHKMMRQLEGQKGGRKKKEESSSDEESKEDSSDDEIMDEAEEKGSDESESDPDASEEGSIDESDAGDLDAADAHDAENIQRSHDDDSENSDDPDFIVIDNDEQVFLPKKLRKRRLYKSSSDEDAMQVELYDEPMIPGLEFTNQDFDKEDSSHNHSEESLKQDEESSSSSSSTKRQREESSSDDDTPPHKKPRPDD